MLNTVMDVIMHVILCLTQDHLEPPVVEVVLVGAGMKEIAACGVGYDFGLDVGSVEYGR